MSKLRKEGFFLLSAHLERNFAVYWKVKNPLSSCDIIWVIYRVSFIVPVLIISGFSRYLNSIHNIDIPPNQFWYCTLSITIAWMSSLCSTLFILNMTFERFYSIIRPHKAASFNTVTRAKMKITGIIVISILFNIPHLYITAQEGRACIPYGNAIHTIIGQFYYWVSLVINFAFPFVLLLIMNSFIIHTIRQRSVLGLSRSSSQGQGQNHGNKIKNSEMQMFVILLLVTFGFLILMTPSYVLFVYVMFVDYEKSAQAFAGFTLFYSVGQKTYYTNYAINFFLYVISGKKFRTDLLKLFGASKQLEHSSSGNTVETGMSSIQDETQNPKWSLLWHQNYALRAAKITTK